MVDDVEQRERKAQQDSRPCMYEYHSSSYVMLLVVARPGSALIQPLAVATRPTRNPNPLGLHSETMML